MRVRSARLVALLVALAAARGCYSSVAPTAKIDPGFDDSGLPVVDAGTDSCVPRKPWEGPGVTGVIPVSAGGALVLSGDRYFNADIDTASGDAADPAFGMITGWHESGDIRTLWSTAPPFIGLEPWDTPGVTSAYVDKATGAQLIISRFRRWVHEGDQWPASGNIFDDWIVADAGPTPLDGQAPWQGAGVTATYFSPNGATFTAVSQDKGWLRKTADSNPANWTWEGPEGGAFYLADTPPWSSAPAVGGQRPFDGAGVTAAFFVGFRFFVISVDKLWVFDGFRWTSSGLLKDTPGWTSAPAAACAN